MADYLIIAYFFANTFFAGFFLAREYKDCENRFQRIICLLWCLGTIFLGCVYIPLVFLYVGLVECYRKIDGIFQVSFWFTFYLTKKWHNLDWGKLSNLNKVALNHRNKNTFSDRMYRHCTQLVNERNKYVHKTGEESF